MCMTSIHRSLCLLCLLLAGIFLTSSYAQTQSPVKRIFQQGYVQLSGFAIGDFVPGDNSSTRTYHVQLAVGTKFKDAWGVGIGAGSWGIRDGWYRMTRHTVVGPHIRYIRHRWIAHFEMGGLIGYQLQCNSTATSDRLSLSQPFGSPFMRLQYGIRFLRHWTIGLSASFLPAVKSEGFRYTWTGSGTTAPIRQKANIWGGQIFVGVLLENGRSKKP